MMNKTRQQQQRGQAHGLSKFALSLSHPSIMLMWMLSINSALGFAAVRTPGTKLCVDVTRNPSSSTRLHYEVQTLTKKGRWWSPFLSSENKSSEDQTNRAAVDDYLDFLERRYQRLHSTESASQSQSRFSALKWLTQVQEESPFMQQRQQDDALYVLGVAGLASQELLQKDEQKLRLSEPVEVIQSVEVSESPVVPAAVWMLLAKLTPLANQLAMRRQQLLRYQARQMKWIAHNVALSVKSLKLAPSKAGSALLRMGGGKKNIGLTVTAMAAMTIFLLRPLASVLMSVRNA